MGWDGLGCLDGCQRPFGPSQSSRMSGKNSDTTKAKRPSGKIEEPNQGGDRTGTLRRNSANSRFAWGCGKGSWQGSESSLESRRLDVREHISAREPFFRLVRGKLLHDAASAEIAGLILHWDRSKAGNGRGSFVLFHGRRRDELGSNLPGTDPRAYTVDDPARHAGGTCHRARELRVSLVRGGVSSRLEAAELHWHGRRAWRANRRVHDLRAAPKQDSRSGLRHSCGISAARSWASDDLEARREALEPAAQQHCALCSGDQPGLAVVLPGDG